MEDFSKMIDEYWDDEMVQSKITADQEDDVDEEEFVDSRIDSPFTPADEISIDDFVNRYLDIKGNFSRFRHFELKTLNCPYIIGVKNEYADQNVDFVKNKKYLLIVIDRNGKRGTYINPVIAREFFDFNPEDAKEFMSQRKNDFEHLVEFFENYLKIKAKYEAYQEFFNILKETKKIMKFKSIKKFENKLGDEENDKHKRK